MPSNERPSPPEPSPPSLPNRIFDVIAGPHDAFLGLDAPAYLALGVFGLAVAFTAFFALGSWLAVPLSLLVVLLVASLVIFVGAGLLRRAITRQKRNHVLWEDVLLASIAGGFLAHAMHQPVWRALDLLSVGIGAFMVFGRLGCLFGGCCHGRPSRIGIAYREPNAVAEPLFGLRLFPVQLVEAIWLLSITAVGAVIAVLAPPGTAVWWWFVAYGAGRFVLEFARGDLGRLRVGPLTEAQWLAIAVVAARIFYDEPIDPQKLFVLGAAVVVVIAGYATHERWLIIERLLPVARIGAWLDAIKTLESEAIESSGGAPARSIALDGTRIALTIDPAEGAWLYAYSFTGAERPLGARAAFALAGLIAQRLPRHRVLRAELDERGLFHLWLWLLERPASDPTAGDAPEFSRYRAFAFARSLRDLHLHTQRPEPAAEVDRANAIQPAATERSSPAPALTRAEYFGRKIDLP